MAVKILIVDDHPMGAEGLKSLLANVEGIAVSGTGSNAFDTNFFPEKQRSRCRISGY